MKLLTDIPIEKYNDTEYCYNFLNSHETIGGENSEYNGFFHIHWRGPLDNNKIILQIKSILATQHVEKIYFWIEDLEVTKNSLNFPNLYQFKDYVEIKVFNRNIIAKAPGSKGVKTWVMHYYDQPHGDYRYKTDMFRWIVLSIYGGVYTDADTLMLRDIRDIKINNWSSKWGVDPFAECCILKLEKGSDAYEQMFRNDPQNPQCFLNIQNNLPQAFSYKYDNLRITSLPSAFFDIVWNEWGNEKLKFLNFNTFPKFFELTDKEVTIDTFFKGCFAFHWHNRWDAPELKNSFAGRLNVDLDRIIKEKYNITPIKIFQDE